RLSKPLPDTNSESPPYYLIVDYQRKIFYLATNGQLKTMREGFIFTLRSMLKTKKPSWVIFAFSSPRLDVDLYFWTISHGWRQDSKTKMSARNWIEYLKSSNYSQKSLDS